MTGFADDPNEIRHLFRDLPATVPLGAFLDGMTAGREHLASYTSRPTALKPADGQTVTDVAAQVADEVMEVIYCRVLAAYTAESTR